MLNRSDGFAASVVLVATLLAGCAGLGLGEAKTAPRQGSSFDTALANDYLQLSTDEYGEGDYRNSDTFAVASMVAGAGESPMPAEVNSRGLPADKVAELSAARTRLTSAMDKGASQKMPAETARAQVMFDCWMQEQEENWPFQKDQVADCRDGFLYAMEQVDAAPDNYLVFFDLNSASLTPEGTGIVQKAAWRQVTDELRTLWQRDTPIAPDRPSIIRTYLRDAPPLPKTHSCCRVFPRTASRPSARERPIRWFPQRTGFANPRTGASRSRRHRRVVRAPAIRCFIATPSTTAAGRYSTA